MTPTLRRFCQPLLIASLVALPFAIAPPSSRAVGFMDPGPLSVSDPNNWQLSSNGATVNDWNCANDEDFGCVDTTLAESGSVTLWTLDSGGSSLGWTSDPLVAAGPGQPGYQISFNYSFLDAFESQAYYAVGGQVYSLNPTYSDPSLEAFTSRSVYVANGQTFSFGVVAGVDASSGASLGITNFSYAAVPAPLPLLGAGAAFGWIRRRRARLRAVSAQGRSIS